jgi:ATP-dependent RNA helicase DDX18/HAS1
MSSAGRPKKRKRPFPAPLAPLPSDEKEAQDQNRQQEGEHETGKVKGKEGPGILTSRLFSELPISDLTARAITEMGHTRLTHVRPLHPFEILH